MKTYFAPMEGVTGYIFRNAFDEYYGHKIIDKYFMPFISPNKSTGFRQRDINDVLPDHNQNKTVIPQILTNQTKEFFRTLEFLQQYGYQEVNLNLGCPSGTVVSKNKGAGFLAVPEELDSFLETIFEQKPKDMRISIKTRLGMEDPEEFKDLLKIYNQYDLEELIIHPRVQKDYYKNEPNMAAFEEAVKNSTNPVCYNGNIFNLKSYQSSKEQFPDLEAVMLGRGLIGNPGLADEIACGHYDEDAVKKLKEFHDRLLSDYQQIMSGDMNAIYKMKEIWFYMKHAFADSEKFSKRIKKAQRIVDYNAAVTDLFTSCKMKDISLTNF